LLTLKDDLSEDLLCINIFHMMCMI
jgi:hypothetical protein